VPFTQQFSRNNLNLVARRDRRMAYRRHTPRQFRCRGFSLTAIRPANAHGAAAAGLGETACAAAKCKVSVKRKKPFALQRSE
jgi:hypothetical protein